MPEPVTFTTEETPAISPENEEMLKELNADPEAKAEEGEALLAGKYKNPEELEKAYKELESKLGQTSTTETETDEDTNQPADTTEKETPTDGSAREIYGEFIGSKLEENEIDFNSMSNRWQETGQLEDADYTELEGAGFNRTMVDAYLRGLAQDTEMKAQEVNQIKADYGGEKGYQDLLQWAVNNLPQTELTAFNKMVNTGDINQAKLAVAGLDAKRTVAEGREPKLVGGRASKQSVARFESTAQLIEAMSDPKYSKDPAFRAKVSAKLKNSNIQGMS